MTDPTQQGYPQQGYPQQGYAQQQYPQQQAYPAGYARPRDPGALELLFAKVLVWVGVGVAVIGLIAGFIALGAVDGGANKVHSMLTDWVSGFGLGGLVTAAGLYVKHRLETRT